MNGLIDTHCHLAHGRLQQNIQEVLSRACAAGVQKFICTAGDIHESRAACGLANKYPDVYYTAGVQPHDAKDVPEEYLQLLEQLAANPKNVAIGEIGLDYHYDFSPRPDQQRVFAEQLQLAKQLNKVAVIHNRESLDDCLAILKDSQIDCRSVVFHSFTGDLNQATRILDLGAMISFSGIVTFKNAVTLHEAAKIVPDERILIETDSPYLSPEPVRKMKTNEPANVAHVTTYLAQLRNVSCQALAELTTLNASRFFNLDAEIQIT